jgi:hypothetical protein
MYPIVLISLIVKQHYRKSKNLVIWQEPPDIQPTNSSLKHLKSNFSQASAIFFVFNPLFLHTVPNILIIEQKESF